MDNGSGVGVLDKAALVLAALEAGPATLAGLVAGTGLARPTAHRLAVALEHHRLVARDMQGRFVLGPRLAELSAAAGEDRPYAAAARRDDLTGLPPAWIGVGDLDLFHAEDVAYAARLRAAGVPCELHVEPGMYHGADALRGDGAAVTRAFRRRSLEALRPVIGRPAAG